ncbi:MAG TPA: hypothetical protein VL092_12380 [Chitinophagaceae bacterium]|nr:hypothetical protein [Chitinophagaceae bacterium]
MRQWIAYFMLTIFSFQVLPVKEIGRILFKSLITEEIHEDYEECDELKFKESMPFRKTPSFSYEQRRPSFEQKLALSFPWSSLIEHQHFPGIFVPPPNA